MRREPAPEPKAVVPSPIPNDEFAQSEAALKRLSSELAFVETALDLAALGADFPGLEGTRHEYAVRS